MWRIRIFAALAAVGLLISPLPALAQASFQGLGHLAGSSFFSVVWDLSADGSVAAGRSNTASGREAFRWTSDGGMVGLGDLPGGYFSSFARALSADGAVVAGYSISTSGYEAFRWTSAGGMVGLGDLPGGVFKSVATGVSADGSVIV
ncbi:MAG: PEP-CTERM sorting domain-containing protein, partial [Nitrospirota bacterium]|nr:PEP-CTERM sorting domain-containing protein [Nitrospirota bacterium]